MTDPASSLVERPEPAHGNDSATNEDDLEDHEPDPNLEATELRAWSREVSTVRTNESGNSNARTDGLNHRGLRRLATPEIRKNDGPIRKFWRRQIHVAVSHEDCRDHLACERTFLGYIRTSVALSMIGVVTAQLFRLQPGEARAGGASFYDLGKPISGLFIASAILITILGGWRFWRLQNAIVRKKAVAAGWELHCVTLVVGALMLVVLIAILKVNPEPAVSMNTVPGPQRQRQQQIQL